VHRDPRTARHVREDQLGSVVQTPERVQRMRILRGEERPSG
jgi:hypothetical protein